MSQTLLHILNKLNHPLPLNLLNKNHKQYIYPEQVYDNTIPKANFKCFCWPCLLETRTTDPLRNLEYTSLNTSSLAFSTQ